MFYGRNKKIKKVWNHPTNWPSVPEGWSPRPDWTPPLDWPAAPKGWEFYVEASSIKKPEAPTNVGPLPPRVLYSAATSQAAMLPNTAAPANSVKKIDEAAVAPVVDTTETEVVIGTIKTLPFISGATKKQLSDHVESLSAGYAYIYNNATELEKEITRLKTKAETVDDLLNTLLSQIQASGSHTAELESLKLTIGNWKRLA